MSFGVNNYCVGRGGGGVRLAVLRDGAVPGVSAFVSIFCFFVRMKGT